jgi:pimeloyl-ACP methyl ester carboxylesterase
MPMKRWVASIVVPLLAACASGPLIQEVTPVERSFFYVGGKYAGEKGKEVMQGAMYVEKLQPARASRKYPLVLFHGAAQTATNWMGTPDGRKGWAQYFVEQGFVVYMVDQPARGRSAWHGGIDGKLTSFSVPLVETIFTAPAELGNWPQAKKHTQWPGEGPRKGRMGDPIFDQFYASQVEGLASSAETQALVQAAGTALLDRIGPAVVLVHSQAGPFGWLLADARPKLVKGVLAIEPNGPPFQASPARGGAKQLPWGPTDIRLTYAPDVKEATELQVELQAKPDAPDLIACWMQKEPARQLPNLKGIPILVLIAEASYHAGYDHCTSKYLVQAGVANEMVRLESVGIHGNGHMVMLEKNNLDIAAWLVSWVEANVK